MTYHLTMYLSALNGPFVSLFRHISPLIRSFRLPSILLRTYSLEPCIWVGSIYLETLSSAIIAGFSCPLLLLRNAKRQCSLHSVRLKWRNIPAHDALVH